VHEIQAPTLAIAGEGDIGSPPHMSEYIVNAVADGRLVVIPGVKHDMLNVAPDQIAKEIIAHLEG